MTHEDKLIAAAKAEDTYDLLNHIAWTDVIRPALQKQVRDFAQVLVDEALGAPLPPGKTREQVAGICYGISYITKLFEKVLKDGERALKELQSEGVSLSSLAK